MTLARAPGPVAVRQKKKAPVEAPFSNRAKPKAGQVNQWVFPAATIWATSGTTRPTWASVT